MPQMPAAAGAVGKPTVNIVIWVIVGVLVLLAILLVVFFALRR